MKKFLCVSLITLLTFALLGGTVSAQRPRGFDAQGCMPLITEPGEAAQPLIFCRGDKDLTMQEVTWVEGLQGQAVRFNGVDEYFRIGYNSLQLADFTLSLWVNWDGASSVAGGSAAENQRIFSARGEPRDLRYLTLSPLETTAAGEPSLRYFMQYHNSSWELTHPQARPLTQGSWYHIALVSTEETVSLYLNGVLLDEEMTMMGLAEMRLYQLYFGKGTSKEGDGYFNGRMDNAYLYNRALTAEELAALHSSQTPTTTTTTTTRPPEVVPEVDLTPDYSLPAIPPVVWIVSGTVLGLVVLLTLAVNIRYARQKKNGEPSQDKEE